MKLELLDTYNIRARLCPCLILISPIIIALFLCLKETISLVSSTVFTCILLVFTNYIIAIQRKAFQKKTYKNYASLFLMPNDSTIDAVTKRRYYSKLSKCDETLSAFLSPTNEISKYCDSAVIFLRAQTRDNRMILEENINYGFMRNLFSSKIIGIVLCSAVCISFGLSSVVKYQGLPEIPTEYIISFIYSFILLLFWIFGVSEKMTDKAAKQYAFTLLMAIDTL